MYARFQPANIALRAQVVAYVATCYNRNIDFAPSQRMFAFWAKSSKVGG